MLAAEVPLESCMATTRSSLSRRVPPSVRRWIYIAALLVSVLLVLAFLYPVAGGFHPVMAVSVVPAGMSLLAHYLRKKYGLDEQVDDPTKPERFYH